MVYKPSLFCPIGDYTLILIHFFQELVYHYTMPYFKIIDYRYYLFTSCYDRWEFICPKSFNISLASIFPMQLFSYFFFNVTTYIIANFVIPSKQVTPEPSSILFLI